MKFIAVGILSLIMISPAHAAPKRLTRDEVRLSNHFDQYTNTITRRTGVETFVVQCEAYKNLTINPNTNLPIGQRFRNCRVPGPNASLYGVDSLIEGIEAGAARPRPGIEGLVEFTVP